jgi:hypothetical protein
MLKAKQRQSKTKQKTITKAKNIKRKEPTA